MQSDCRTNMRNMEGETAIDIAFKEGYDKIVAELSGLGKRRLNFQESSGCGEIRKLLLHDKEDDDTRLSREGEKLWKKERNLKKHRKSEQLTLETSWQEKLDTARAEVLAKYESRIAEVEKQYRMKVNLIEQQYSRHLGVRFNSYRGFGRSPSAPDNRCYDISKITRAASQ